MARAAVLGRLNPRRLTWRVATVAEVRAETATTSTLVLDVPDWTGHLAGQHVDLRLTAPDGYSVQRSYSIASAPDHSTVELTVQLVPDGEVSSYLVGVAMPGDQIELRGPVGGYFTWDPTELDPVLLVAGGSGIVPLMAMIRTRAGAGSRVPFRLVYSVRDPESLIYAAELTRRVRDDHGLDVAYVYTRSAPPEHRHRPGRINAARLAEDGWPAELAPRCYVCGPTAFVEAAADLLVAAGHPPSRVRTERFG
jgi:ferredoxin-NADP reductase